MSKQHGIPKEKRTYYVRYNNIEETIPGLELDLLRQSGVQVRIIKKPQQPKQTVFTVTERGLAKRESGKYKSRWHNSDNFRKNQKDVQNS